MGLDTFKMLISLNTKKDGEIFVGYRKRPDN